MKKQMLFTFALSALFFTSCENKQHAQAVKLLTVDSASRLPVLPAPLIPKDSANKMISSYLNSINYASNDSDIQSLVINAKLLRLYLDSLESTNPVEQIKIMFAHNLDYINTGHGNTNAGYKRNAFTVVLIGINAQGDYVFFPGNTAFNKSMPCPTSCPNGTASNPQLQ